MSVIIGHGLPGSLKGLSLFLGRPFSLRTDCLIKNKYRNIFDFLHILWRVPVSVPFNCPAAHLPVTVVTSA